jgi:hypothetical protein
LFLFFLKFLLKPWKSFFFHAAGTILVTRCNGFGIMGETEIHGPYSTRFSDDSRRPTGAAAVHWRVNGMEVEVELIELEGNVLRVVYLPLQVAVKDDPHIVVTIVNHTGEMLNIAEGIRNAACYADGNRYPSNTGGHWDGGTHVQPEKAVTKQFSLADFPGVPQAGMHQMNFEILGIRSESEMVDWKGM